VVDIQYVDLLGVVVDRVPNPVLPGLAFSPSGSTLAVGDNGHIASLWKATWRP
jgi:predicted secreted protein